MKKWKLYIIAMVATILFVPSVMAASTPEYETLGGKNVFFANGTSITIEASNEGTIIKWEGGSKVVPVDTTVFGGSHGLDTTIDSVSITMNSGKVKNIFGGGLHLSNVGTTNIVINDGTITGGVVGGGAASFVKENCEYGNPWYSDSAIDSINRTDETNVTINGGTIFMVYGGGEGISYTGEANVTINGGTFTYVTAGGSNGYTGIANVEINDGEIEVLQGINRGTMDGSIMTVNGGTIENAYVTGEEANDITGVTESAALSIIGGKVTNVSAGYNNGTTDGASDIAVLVYDEAALESAPTGFDDKVKLSLAVIIEDEDEIETLNILVDKGISLESMSDELEALIGEVEDGYVFNGYFEDKTLKTKFDFNKNINDDTTIYMHFAKKTETPKEESAKNEEPPKTGDMNLLLVLGAILLGGTGIIATRKKYVKNN